VEQGLNGLRLMGQFTNVNLSANNISLNLD